MGHKERVVDYIKEYGAITSLEAIRDLGCTRLSAVIFNLKKDGYEFETEWEKSKNRWGDKVSFIKYKFKEQE